MEILTAIAFPTARIAKATKGDDSELLRVLKCLCGTQAVVLVLDGRPGTAHIGNASVMLDRLSSM